MLKKLAVAAPLTAIAMTASMAFAADDARTAINIKADIPTKQFHAQPRDPNFGKDETIQSLLPAYKVEGMLRKENLDRYDDRINPPLRTNLIDTYLEEKYLKF